MKCLPGKHKDLSSSPISVVVPACKPSSGEAGTSNLLELSGQPAESDQQAWGLNERLGLSGWPLENDTGDPCSLQESIHTYTYTRVNKHMHTHTRWGRVGGEK